MSNKCRKCNKDFNSPVELLQHRLKHCKPRTCSNCGSTIATPQSLDYHFKNRKLIQSNHCVGKFCNNDHFHRYQRTIQQAVNRSVPDLNHQIYPVSGYEEKDGWQRILTKKNNEIEDRRDKHLHYEIINRQIDSCYIDGDWYTLISDVYLSCKNTLWRILVLASSFILPSRTQTIIVMSPQTTFCSTR